MWTEAWADVKSGRYKNVSNELMVVSSKLKDERRESREAKHKLDELSLEYDQALAHNRTLANEVRVWRERLESAGIKRSTIERLEGRVGEMLTAVNVVESGVMAHRDKTLDTADELREDHSLMKSMLTAVTERLSTTAHEKSEIHSALQNVALELQQLQSSMHASLQSVDSQAQQQLDEMQKVPTTHFCHKSIGCCIVLQPALAPIGRTTPCHRL